VGSTVQEAIPVTNIGSQTLTFSGIPQVTSPAGGVFQEVSTTCGATLLPQATCTVIVAFTPTLTNGYSGTLTFSFAELANALNVQLTGSGNVTAPSVALSAFANPFNLSFGPLNMGSSLQKTVTLTNNGNQNLNLSGPPTVSGDSQYSLLSTTCGSILVIAANCTATVQFSPTSAGYPGGTLTFPLVEVPVINVPISGQGVGGVVAPITSWYPDSWFIDFGTLDVGSIATRVMTITNNGNTPVAFSAYAGYSEIQPSGNQCAEAILPGNTCTITWTYAPQENNYFVNYGGWYGFHWCCWVGYDAAVNGLPVYFSGHAINAPPTPPSLIPAVSANTTAVDFGTVAVGAYGDQLITVTNTGLVAASVGPSVSGDPAYSIITNFCGYLPTTTACGFTVRYTPTGAGTQTGTVTINYGGASAITIPVTGSAIAQ
jgi:hypothetical protein